MRVALVESLALKPFFEGADAFAEGVAEFRKTARAEEQYDDGQDDQVTQTQSKHAVELPGIEPLHFFSIIQANGEPIAPDPFPLHCLII